MTEYEDGEKGQEGILQEMGITIQNLLYIAEKQKRMYVTEEYAQCAHHILSSFRSCTSASDSKLNY